MPIRPDKRTSGISLIGELPWGSSFCQFYRTAGDMLEILVPYFKAGLESNELCLWVTSGQPGDGGDGTVVMPDDPFFGNHFRTGHIEIVPHDQWLELDESSGCAVVSMLDRAILAGFDGLRLAFSMSPDIRGDGVPSFGWLDDASRYNVLALFAYPRDMFDAAAFIDVVKSHRFALVRNGDRWEVIESSEARTVRDELRKSEEKLHALFSNMSEGFAYNRIVLDPDGNPRDFVFLEVNEAFEKLTGLAAGEVLGRRFTQVLPEMEKDTDDWIGKLGSVAMTGAPLQFESRVEGLGRWYSVSSFSAHKGSFAIMLSDISSRKEAEEALRKAHLELAEAVEARTGELRQKEVLLREIHHRVKNNLQVISSLVSLQSDASMDETVREVLRDVTYRVRSMALVHEKLYQSADLSHIDFAEYCRSLMGYLWRAHGACAASIRLTLDLEPLSLPVDTAVPCGLVLNELAGNALKHAFRGREEGEIAVAFRSGSDGYVRLCVRDDGVGLPPGLDWRNSSSLGLRLVQLLAGQLGAEVEVTSGENQGTSFNICFSETSA